MRRNTNVALVSLGLLLGTAGCDSFLTGNKLSENPNLPTIATIQPLFVGIQAGQFAFQEGTVAMMMCQWVQACAGGNGRFVQQAAQYVFNETSNIGANGGDWLTAYGGGGLIDIKTIEALALGAGDSTWLGIAKIWDAFTIGTIADMWGDVPYSEIGTARQPVLDNQMTIYSNIQTLLTGAIAELQSDSGAGPGVRDLVFANLASDVAAQRATWIRVAWTLKARYYMHTAESLGVPAYTAAIAAALNGINDPTGNSDFRSAHTTKNSERNMWAQFQTSSGFGTDLEAGKAITDYMNARNDPRRAQYFCPNAGGGYGGDDYNTVVDPDSISLFECQPARFADAARIPYVTYVENELILAEAYNKTGNDALAATHLNNAYATVPGLASVAAGTGAVLLDSIMLEKWVAMFQNIESINDYRRTCIPALTPSTNTQGFANVPGRLYYPQTERNANQNIPDPTIQNGTHFFRNRADVAACTVNNAR
jgi:hypothetical protein